MQKLQSLMRLQTVILESGERGMYSVVIIDDEAIVCAGLKKHIPWEANGFVVEKAFTSSLEALEYLKNNDIDMVLTDIEMPSVTGIDIAKYIFEERPNTVVCFISGHQNFDYAKSALKYGVVDYIVKPTEVAMAEECLITVKKKLDEKHITKQVFSNTDDEVYELARNQLIADVFTGFFSDEKELNAKIEMLKKVGQSELKYGSFWIIFNNEKSKTNHSISTFLNELFAESAFSFQPLILKNNEAFVIAVSKSYENTKICRNTLLELLENFRDKISKKYMVESEFNITFYCDTLDEFLDYLFQPFVVSDDEIVQPEMMEVLNEKFKTLFLSVTLCDEKKLVNCFGAIKNMLSKLSEKSLKKIIINFFEVFFEKLPNTTDWNFAWIEVHTLKRISESKNCEEILSATLEILHSVQESLSQSKDDNCMKFFIKKSCMYVENHYMENITVEFMANYLFLNASYFSRMFKVYMHENFKKYLSKVRIAKALEFYRNGNYTTAQIADLVGYKSSKYFRQQFKNIMGKNFSQYLTDLGCKENTDEED